MARRLKKAPPEVNAGSMADIAFLLLIFFLVTTTIGVDQGISRKLPPIEKEPEKDNIIKEKNILTVLVNKNDQLMVEEVPMKLTELRETAIKFLENNGDGSCAYCPGGERNPDSSDNPEKAVISLSNDSETSYEMYIKVQNELVAAYYFLRDREAQKKYGVTFREMEYVVADPASRAKKGLVEKLEPKVKEIQDMFPQRLSEAEPKRQ